jgi:hypothetical protein
MEYLDVHVIYVYIHVHICIHIHNIHTYIYKYIHTRTYHIIFPSGGFNVRNSPSVDRDPRRADTPSRSTKHTIKHHYIKPINPIYWLHIIYLIEANLI